ncbi:predicted protein [Sclerotinia sclerotiorum 1980 UF-70]|uniref:Uncharacterized protein n=1 Tax=Sclerotinia sclerotiorum (strain ATCC 18683 / 1980 / Ss-1) TaxID=665079 RepID=A7ETI7_SCLS1|nr:predicted protein [Sclerotinia sclerotiorum 1980 UF-70]EDN92779.1 predicted protein [Sclerotinia sclerotiorum 1980 UF-70]
MSALIDRLCTKTTHHTIKNGKHNFPSSPRPPWVKDKFWTFKQHNIHLILTNMPLKIN